MKQSLLLFQLLASLSSLLLILSSMFLFQLLYSSTLIGSFFIFSVSSLKFSLSFSILLSRPVSIFTVITYNLLKAYCLSPFHLVILWGLVLFFDLKNIPLPPNLAWLSVFVFMDYAEQLLHLNLKEWCNVWSSMYILCDWWLLLAGWSCGCCGLGSLGFLQSGHTVRTFKLRWMQTSVSWDSLCWGYTGRAAESEMGVSLGSLRHSM